MQDRIRTKFPYVKLVISAQSFKIMPAPISCKGLQSIIREKILENEEEFSIYYHGLNAERVKILGDTGLSNCYRFATGVPELYIELQKDEVVVNSSITEDSIMNYSLLTEFRDPQNPVNLANFSYDQPTAFFKRLAEHIVHVAATLGPATASEQFSISLNVVNYLRLTLSKGIIERPYPLPCSLLTDEPSVHPEITVKKCFSAIQRFQNKETTMSSICEEFNVTETEVSKWLRVFSTPSSDNCLTEEYVYPYSFRQSTIEDYLLNRYTNEDLLSLFRVTEDMIIYWIHFDLNSNRYQDEDIDYEAIDTEAKTRICQKLQSGAMKMKEAVNLLNVRPNTIRKWVQKFNKGENLASVKVKRTASETLRKAYFRFKEMLEARKNYRLN